MKLRHFIWALFSLCSMTILGCGNGAGGGEGLNGSIEVTASATGSVVNATATYKNPQTSNLIGVPLNFKAVVGGVEYPLGEHNTNGSGSIGMAFTVPPFNGAQTITVIVTTGNLSGFASVSMTGRSLTFTPPAAVTLTTTADPTVTPTVPFTIPASASFITVTDPFSSSAGLTFTITGTFTPGAPNSLSLVSPTTVTNTAGVAQFQGASGVIAVPASAGGVTTMTINWTVTDPVTGLTGSGTTIVTLTKSA